MAEKFIIPHPNIPTADIGLPKLKEVTVKNNENFLALDRLIQEFASNFDAVGEKIESMRHEHPYAPIEHTHLLSDVEGLIAALELKAPLIHTHPEYLTEVPVHGHKESEIDGLLADLAGKADIQHKHNIGDVYALQESLNGKASNDYVLWLESQMARVSQDEIPLVDGDPQSGAGVIGTSDKAARADHRHPVNKTSNVSNIKHDGNGTGGTPQIGTLFSYALTDHSHPLNYPSGKPTNVLAPDGNGTGDTPQFGDSNYYADLYHSHPLNVGTGGTPADVVKSNGTASLGSSGYYSRQDHVHKLPELTKSDIEGLVDELEELTELISNNTESIVNHEGRIATLEARPSGGGTVKSVLGVQPDSSGNVGTGILGTDASHAAAGNHTHTSSAITDFDTAVKALIDADLTNYAKNDDFAKDDDDCFTEPLAQHAHWADGVIVIQGTSGEMRLDDYFFGDKIDGTKVGNLTAGKWVKTNATTGVLETTDDDPILSDGECDSGELPMMDEDGVLTASGIIAPILVEKGKVLTADGEGGSSWEDAEAELDQVEDGKVVVGESFTEDGESKIRLTSKSNFAKDIDALLLKTSGQSHKVEIDAQKVRFKEVLGSPDAGDFVCLDANLNLTAVRPEDKLAAYAKSSELDAIETIANNAASAAASASSAASQAVSTANTANTNANSALSGVQSLQTALAGLQSTVAGHTSSIGSLSTQVDTISTAVETLIDVTIAKMDAEIEAATQTAESAEQTATSAQQTAESAETTAEDAQTRVGVIEGDYLTSDDLTNLITKQEIPQAFINAIASTYQGTVEIGGRISWNGTQITQPVRTLTLTAGLITGISAATTVTIPTVQYSN